MNWNMIYADRFTGLTASLLTNVDDYAIVAAGAGMAILSSDIIVTNISVTNNWISSKAGLGVGGAIYLAGSPNVVIDSSSIQYNNVHAFHAAGAGIAVTQSSTLRVSRCDTMKNSVAVAYGSCLYFTSKVICPSAFGANILVAAKSTAVIQSSNLDQGMSICNTSGAMCSAVGGSIAVIHTNSELSLFNSTCQSSSASIMSSSQSTSTTSTAWNAGGCLFVQDASVSMFGVDISNNTATGTSFGGGIYCSGSGIMMLAANSTVTSNAAKQGGAVAISDTCTATISHSTLKTNIGSSVGGALFMKGDSKLNTFHTSFLHNIGDRASTVYSFNDNGNAFYNMSNSFGIVEVGSSAVMLGRLSMSTTVWNCSQSGTVFVQDLTKEFFSLTCNPCSAGSYAVDSASTLTVDRKCQTCPFGASCLGSSPQSNGLHALPSFWGLNNNGSVKFYQCPSGYCCGGVNSNCTYDYCDGNRTGLLCGQCGPDHGMRFFTASCKSNSDCNDGVWFAWIIIGMAFAAVVALLMTTGGVGQSSGMLSVLLYYYQVLPLIKSTPWKYTSPTLMLILQSAFNFSPSGSSSDSDGVCLISNMTTSQKIGSRMLLQGVICLAIVVTYIVHFGCWKARIHRWFDDHRPHIYITLLHGSDSVRLHTQRLYWCHCR